MTHPKPGVFMFFNIYRGNKKI